MKQSKKFWTFLSSFVGFGTIIALACAGGDWDETEGSMFAPEIINKPVYEPFFRSQYLPFYKSGFYTNPISACYELNLKEWDLYFNKKVGKESISYWLYEAESKEVNNMIFTIKGTTKDIPKLSEKSKLNSLISVQPSEKATAFLYYVGFAKRNETYTATEGNGWDEKESPTAVDINKQIEGGLKFFTNAKNPLLKERYLFQLIRLYYFNKQYKEAIDLYTANVSSFSNETSMKWRTMEYIAGVYYKQKQYSQANYLYSVVFDQLDEHKQSAYLSFHPQEEKDWQQSLALAKSTHEKAVLWQLFGIANDPALAIREIYKLDPKAAELDLLLVRLVNIEEDRFTSRLMRKAFEPKQEALQPNYTILNTVSDIASKGNTSNPDLWNLAAAYLSYEANKYDKGDSFLKSAEKAKTGDRLIQAQYYIVSLAGKLNRAEKIDAATEKNMLPELKILFDHNFRNVTDVRMNFAERWTRNVLAVLYANNKEYEKSEMIVPGTVAGFLDKNENVKKMIAYYENPKHSELEQLFMQHDSRSKNSYIDLLGVRYAQQDMLDSSLVAFNKVNSDATLLGNPFTIHIKDCHDCDHMAAQKTKYTSAKFIEKMIEMKNKAKVNKAEAAQNYFLVANGFYNMTYYGNARIFYEYAINPNDKTSYVKRETQDDLDCSLALKYYLLAKENSTDKEFSAKCTFMAAKCEQNTWYRNVPAGYEGDFQSGKYFRMLKKEYAATAYYQEILKECSYFSLFNAK
ncbi:MAG: hypothetical protein K0S33_232 [Bacteroidetes bacterium]|jgi:hypothetical protein|nr:hypothetical protein [Bacteroidota bacterium]